MTYKIKKEIKKCKECGKEAQNYYSQITICDNCLRRLKNNNKLKNVKKIK
jgi:ribosomal protein S14